MKRKLGTLAAILGATLALGACSTDNNSDAVASSEGETIRIAVAAPLTGANADYGIGFLRATNLQAEEWNANGGLLGQQIEIVAFDDANDPNEASQVAQRIASEGGFAGVIGPFSSGVGLTVAPIYEENDIILISPTASNPVFTTLGENIFRVNTLNQDEVQAIVDIITDQLGHTRIGLISILTDFGALSANSMFSIVEGIEGVEVVAHEEIVETTSDFRPAISNLMDADAEVVVVVGMYSILGPLAVQYRELDPNIDIVAFGSAYTYNLIDLAGPSVEGVLIPVSFYAGAEYDEVRDFVGRFVGEHDQIPSNLTAQAYDAAGALFTAIEMAGTIDSSQVREALIANTYEGVTGPIAFDADGGLKERVFRTLVIENGTFVEVR